MGRLTRDPEIRYTPNNVIVCRFSIAIDRPFTRQGEEKQTDFFNVTAFNRTADFVSKFFTKGKMAIVTGRVQNENWTDNTGVKHYSCGVIAEDVNFGESKKDAMASGYGADSGFNAGSGFGSNQNYGSSSNFGSGSNYGSSSNFGSGSNYGSGSNFGSGSNSGSGSGSEGGFSSGSGFNPGGGFENNPGYESGYGSGSNFQTPQGNLQSPNLNEQPSNDNNNPSTTVPIDADDDLPF